MTYGQDTVSDLRERMQRAVGRLEELRDDKPKGMLEVARLNGKIEGVKLALSYLSERTRCDRI